MYIYIIHIHSIVSCDIRVHCMNGEVSRPVKGRLKSHTKKRLKFEKNMVELYDFCNLADKSAGTLMKFSCLQISLYTLK